MRLDNFLKLPQLITLIIALTCSASSQAQTVKRIKDVKGMPVHATVQDFKAIDQYHDTFQLYKTLQTQPVVLLFIRGQWCPVCNRHLSELQDSLKLIEATGAKVVVVSAEVPEYIDKTIQKTGATFSILYDDQYKIGEQFDVLYVHSAVKRLAVETATDANFSESQTDDTHRLPIPATFIIGQDKKVTWRHFDTNYKNRASVAELLQLLQ